MSGRGKNKFKLSWLSTKDKNEDELSEYISPGDNEFCVYCNWCKRSFQIDNQGKGQIMQQHALSSGHKNVADVFKGRKRGQSMFVSSQPKPSEKTIPEANNNAQHSVKNFLLPVLSSPASLPGSKLSIADQATRGEILLVMKGVESQWTYSSFDNLIEIMKKIDPESKVFAKMELKRSKVISSVNNQQIKCISTLFLRRRILSIMELHQSSMKSCWQTCANL